jgi:SAM-dependent methyltransferase
MSFGDRYASIYDALYRNKDYAQEADFLVSLLNKHASAPVRDLLDLGCGTGLHDVALVQRGFRVHGVDFSPAMVTRAQARQATLPQSLRDALSIQVGDIRALTLARCYDAVISLFHVMSYQVNDADVAATLRNARQHLLPGGLLVFDFWHGPAVVAEGPSAREKSVETEAYTAVRVTRPTWEKERDVVRVRYDVTITDKATREIANVHEEHVVRYFFLDWLIPRVEQADFQIVEQGEWPTGGSAGPHVFDAYLAARAV